MPPRKKRNTGPSTSSAPAIPPDQPEHYGVVLIHDQVDRPVFKTLYNRKMEATRYADTALLQAMGVYDDVRRLFDNIGWGRILEGGWPTYERVVLEMLCSFDEGLMNLPVPDLLAFQLNNVWHEGIDMHRINTIFGCPTRCVHTNLAAYRARLLWNDLVVAGAGEYESGISKASHIRNPVFRMVHRILAHTVCARKENGNVTKVDLYIMEAMLTRTQINFADILVQQLYKVAKAPKGVITIGGMLTPIALSVCPTLERWPTLRGDILLHGRRVCDMKVITRAQPPFSFIQKAGDDFPLPNTALTTVNGRYDQANWKMNEPAHVEILRGMVREIRGQGVGEGAPRLEHGAQEEAGQEEARVEPPPHAHAAAGGSEDMRSLIESMGRLDAHFTVMRGDMMATRMAQQEFQQRQLAFEQRYEESERRHAEFEAYARGEFDHHRQFEVYAREQVGHYAVLEAYQREQFERQQQFEEYQKAELKRQMRQQEELLREFRRFRNPPAP